MNRFKRKWGKQQMRTIKFFDCGRSKDAEVQWTKGWAGTGWYVWCRSYPDEGCEFLGTAKPPKSARP